MGIGPNNLGPDGKEGYTSCGHPAKSPFNKMDDGGMYKLDSGMYKTEQSPLEFNEKLQAAVDAGKITGEFAEAINNNKK